LNVRRVMLASLSALAVAAMATKEASEERPPEPPPERRPPPPPRWGYSATFTEDELRDLDAIADSRGLSRALVRETAQRARDALAPLVDVAEQRSRLADAQREAFAMPARHAMSSPFTRGERLATAGANLRGGSLVEIDLQTGIATPASAEWKAAEAKRERKRAARLAREGGST
jgi:hypothetical protein